MCKYKNIKHNSQLTIITSFFSDFIDQMDGKEAATANFDLYVDSISMFVEDAFTSMDF